MTKTDMAKLPGLFPLKGVYQLRVLIPLDVQPADGGKNRIVQSLGTASYREAVLLGTQERAQLLDEFDSKRRVLAPQRLDTVTPEMVSELAQRVGATVLRVSPGSAPLKITTRSLLVGPKPQCKHVPSPRQLPWRAPFGRLSATAHART